MVLRHQDEPERWERRFSKADLLTDIDTKLVISTINKITQSGRQQFKEAKDLSNMLEDLSVYKYGKLTNAGDVLFALNPCQRNPQIRVKAVCLHSDKTEDNYKDMKHYEGPLFQVLEEVFTFIQRNTTTKAAFSKGSLERIDTPLYPTEALREGLINAFVHRDYSNFSGGLGVFIYPKKLEIWNSGAFPEG